MTLQQIHTLVYMMTGIAQVATILTQCMWSLKMIRTRRSVLQSIGVGGAARQVRTGGAPFTEEPLSSMRRTIAKILKPSCVRVHVCVCVCMSVHAVQVCLCGTS